MPGLQGQSEFHGFASIIEVRFGVPLTPFICIDKVVMKLSKQLRCFRAQATKAVCQFGVVKGHVWQE